MLSIYDDDYEGSPVILTGGPTPFTTDENDSENLYEAVRSQSGTIQVCTRLSDGTAITLNDLLPSDNVARPVRLQTVDDGVIVWQGFLSCEAYNQAYTSIPDVVELPVISVLEAMDSVEVELNSNFAFLKIYGHMAYAMKAIEEKCGMALFSDVYIPSYIAEAMRLCYLYNNVYFKSEELLNEDNIIVEAHSISCKQILERIARFFGGCWREYRRDVHLELPDMSEGDEIRAFHFVNLYQAYVDPGTGSTSYIQHYISSASLAGQTWVGTGHQRSVTQGARRVKVSAALDDFKCKMSLKETPVNNLVENPITRQNWGEVYCNTNEDFYNLAQHKHMLLRYTFPDNMDDNPTLEFESELVQINYQNTIFWEDNYIQTYYQELVGGGQGATGHYWATSYMAYWRNEADELKNGLMLCGVPYKLYYGISDFAPNVRNWNSFGLTPDNWLFKQSSPLVFSANSGYLRIDIQTMRWWSVYPEKNSGIFGRPTITIALQVGDKWAYLNDDKYEWSDTFHTIDYPFELTENDGGILSPHGNWDESMKVDESEGIFIEIPSFMVGFVSVYVYHRIDRTYNRDEVDSLGNHYLGPYKSMFEVLISKLDIDYIPLPEELRTDRSSNNYMSDTGKAFRDEIEVALDMASDANNTKLATMVWDTPTSPAKLLSLGGEMKRPEVDLLNRLTAYYGEARQRLSLEMQHPATPLPLLTFDGINDGKVYAPLSESRDWQKDTSTITCYEIPNNQQS